MQGMARRARAAAIAAAYEPLAGLVQLGEAGGGEGRIWVGAEDSPALGGFAPSPADRRRFLQLVQQFRDDNPTIQSGRRPHPVQRHAGSRAAHGLQGVTISIDAVPSVFGTGLIKQHPICCKLFSLGRGVQGNAADRNNVAAAAAALSAKAVQEVYERFETACDDLDSGLFDLADRHCYCCMQFFAGAGSGCSFTVDGHLWCMACSYQVHGRGGKGGLHPEFATTERPNDRCCGCAGCSPVRR